MYRVTCDGVTIHDARLPKIRVFNANLELELNKTGTFTFLIYSTNDNFECLRKLRSIIKVEEDGEVVFRGRILDEEQAFHNEKQVTCEGELAFLLDSVIEPHGAEESPWKGTTAQYLDKLIDAHNAMMGDDELKKFVRGDVSPSLNVPLSIEEEGYKTPWNLIAEKLVDEYGGYIWVRHVGDKSYIDYLDDLDIQSNQAIELRKNLLDIKKTAKGEGVMTGIIPLGKQADTDAEITIAKAKKSGGKIYIVDTDAEREYGRIYKTVNFEEVKDADDLYEKALEYLKDAIKFPVEVELTAADLSGIKNGVKPFRLGQKLVVLDEYHGLEELAEQSGTELAFLVKKLSIDILQPSNNKLSVGATFATFTEAQTTAAGKYAGKGGSNILSARYDEEAERLDFTLI